MVAEGADFTQLVATTHTICWVCVNIVPEPFSRKLSCSGAVTRRKLVWRRSRVSGAPCLSAGANKGRLLLRKRQTHLSPKPPAHSCDSPSFTAPAFLGPGVSSEWDWRPRQTLTRPGEVNDCAQDIYLGGRSPSKTSYWPFPCEGAPSATVLGLEQTAAVMHLCDIHESAEF